MSEKRTFQSLATLLLASMLIAFDLAAVEPDKSLTVRDMWEATLGGRLYDDWAKTLDQRSPQSTHPSYPKSSAKKGRDTWRCKECHGWDYRGKDGAYGSGSHKTGIKGINAMAGKSLKKIVAVLRNRTHRYNRKLLPDKAAKALARFVSVGQIGMESITDARNHASSGDKERGQRLYALSCVQCHGVDGRQHNFKSDNEPQFLGTLAWINPWEVMHKARFGQPGEYMLTYGEFFDRFASGYLVKSEDIADILAYSQSLPRE